MVICILTFAYCMKVQNKGSHQYQDWPQQWGVGMDPLDEMMEK